MRWSDKKAIQHRIPILCGASDWFERAFKRTKICFSSIKPTMQSNPDSVGEMSFVSDLAKAVTGVGNEARWYMVLETPDMDERVVQ